MEPLPPVVPLAPPVLLSSSEPVPQPAMTEQTATLATKLKDFKVLIIGCPPVESRFFERWRRPSAQGN
jgi:hypothetical protein